MKTSFDIAIVGGGMVGMTLACALAECSDLSIAIFEANDTTYPFHPEQYHHRVSAISLASVNIFKSLKIWDAIKKARISPFTAIDVKDGANQAEIQFSCYDIAKPVLGYIIENNVMQNALRDKIAGFSQIQLFCPVKPPPLVMQNDAILLQTGNGETLTVKLAVAADGARSWLREQVGIGVDKNDYAQRAIVAAVETEYAHAKCARQIFLPSGPLAFLPLAENNLSSIVWSLPSDQANEWQATDEMQFKEKLARAFAYQLGEVKKISQRFTFPLIKQQAANYISERVALVGDAAHVMHPLAGQGVNVGLLDAASLAEVIVNAHQAGRDFSHYKVLRRYERWRRADNLAMMTGVDMIKHFFANENPSVKSIRGMGMTMTNRFSALKNVFTRYAVGGREDLPALALPRD